MKLDKEPEVNRLPYSFSKVADMKFPDSPPPEEEKLEDIEGQPNKFEHLMQAACTIKQTQMESKRKMFERLPAFLKAGVYYTTKLEATRKQSYYPRLFAFQLIMKSANTQYHQGDSGSACRKYEEAYSIWRYFYSNNPKWNTEGIDDTQLIEEEWKGANDQENEWIRQHKIKSLHNMVACYLKEENFEDAKPAAEEILRLDPDNRLGLIRRAKSVSSPVNAGVEDYEQAIADLEKINSEEERILKEILRLKEQVKINRKRERNTYGKMFFSTGVTKKGADGEVVKAEKKPVEIQSITDYVTKKHPKLEKTAVTFEDKEIELEMQKIDRKVKKLVLKKVKEEFSFHLKEDFDEVPEVAELDEIIAKSIEDFKITRKMRRGEEAKVLWESLQQMKFAREHLVHIMNMDFTKPTKKLRDMAKEGNIDLTDPKVLEEFKVMQKQTLQDIKRMKDGKGPQTDEELKTDRKQQMEKRHAERMDELQKKADEEKAIEDKKTEQLMQILNKQQKDGDKPKLSPPQNSKANSGRDVLLLGLIVVAWAGIVVYTNYFMSSEE